MSLSVEQLRRLEVALTSKEVAHAIAAAIDAQGSGPAAKVAAIPASTNLPAAGTQGGATPTATQVDAAIATVAAVAESRLDALETKVNALITALTNAGLMAA